MTATDTDAKDAQYEPSTAKEYYSEKLSEKADGLVLRFSVLLAVITLVAGQSLLMKNQAAAGVMDTATAESLRTAYALLQLLLWYFLLREFVMTGVYWLVAATGKAPYYVGLGALVAVMFGNAAYGTPLGTEPQNFWLLCYLLGAALGLDVIAVGTLKNEHAEWVADRLGVTG